MTEPADRGWEREGQGEKGRYEGCGEAELRTKVSPGSKKSSERVLHARPTSEVMQQEASPFGRACGEQHFPMCERLTNTITRLSSTLTFLHSHAQLAERPTSGAAD